MRIAAHHIVRNLTAGMAMITSREPLLLAINANLKSNMSGFIRVSNIYVILKITMNICMYHSNTFLQRDFLWYISRKN